MRSAAVFSDCRRYRYLLTREWAPGLPSLCVIGLNPSTADETTDDPTIRRCIGFAKREGMGGLVMLNLFAWRATDPRDMKRALDPIGPANDAVIEAVTLDRLVLCAWGVHGAYRLRDAAVIARLAQLGRQTVSLGTTKAGQPKHPLYLAAATPFVQFGAAAAGYATDLPVEATR